LGGVLAEKAAAVVSDGYSPQEYLSQQSLQLGDTLVLWRALAGAVRLRFIKWLSPRDDFRNGMIREE
jgi:hypothetical protein